MRNESAAILDIRSNEVVFLLGAKGVNGTFVISSSHTERYEGFSNGAFLDKQSLRKAVNDSVNAVRQNYGGTIETVHVGVPSAFITVITKGHTVSFSSKRKVSSADVVPQGAGGDRQLRRRGGYPGGFLRRGSGHPRGL